MLRGADNRCDYVIEFIGNVPRKLRKCDALLGTQHFIHILAVHAAFLEPSDLERVANYIADVT